MPATTGLDRKMWKTVFQELMQEVKPSHQWTLTLDDNLIPNDLQPGWTQYQQRVFARFQCSLCSRSWASAKVQVLFHMHWSKKESKGQVTMKIFAQRCSKCSEAAFEVPEFMEENVFRTLNNLVFRILKKCYNEGFKSMEEIPMIKDTSLEGPHDTHNCEACLQGFCTQSGLDLARPSLVSPSLPAVSSPTPRVPTQKPSSTKSNTTVDAVTAGIRVKKGNPNPCSFEPPKAESLRANTNYPVDCIIHVTPASEALYPHTAENRKSLPAASMPTPRVPTQKPSSTRSNTTVDAVTGDTRVKKGEVLPNSCFSELPKTESLRVNTGFWLDRIIQIPPADEDLHPYIAQNHRSLPKISSSTPRIPTYKSSSTRGNTTVDALTGNTRVKKGTVSHNPWFSEPPKAESLRANTNYQVDSVIHITPASEALHARMAQNCRCCSLRMCCCFTILILIIVVVVVVIVKITT